MTTKSKTYWDDALDPANDHADAKQQTPQEILRKRLIVTAILCFFGNIIVTALQIAVLGWPEAELNVITACVFAIIVIAGLVAAIENYRVELVAQITISLALIILWSEALISTASIHLYTPILLAIPLATAIFCSARQVLLLAIVNSLVITVLIGLEIAKGNAATSMVVQGGVVLIIASGFIGMVSALIVHQNERSEEKLRELVDQHAHEANHDHLTGLPNRGVVRLRMAALIASKIPFNVYIVDLDGFKAINDTHGHLTGDQLLNVVAERLSSMIATKDIVARLGGDEFLVVSVADPNNPLERHALAQRLISKIAQPFATDIGKLAITASIGTARFPYDEHEPGLLLKRADEALYTAKGRGKNQYATAEGFETNPAGHTKSA